jgi:hypothetical protein
MGFFISSPIYKAAEEKINSMLDILIANEKVVEDHKKDPSLQVISLFGAIASNNVEDDDKVKVDAASKLYKEKVDAILKNEQLAQNVRIDETPFERIIQESGVKITTKETVESLFNKMDDDRCRLAFACLYFTMLNKPLKVEKDINGQKVDLFNLGKDNNAQNNQQQGNNTDSSTNANSSGENNNGEETKPQPSATPTPQGSTSDSLQTRRSRVKKIYDYYTWQK